MPLKPIQEFGAAYSNASTSEYPSGSYKDETVPGSSRDGSPLVAVTENDRLGFDEALAAEVGMTFTNVPDTAVSSQRLTAHKKLVGKTLSLKIFQSPTDNLTKIETFAGGAGVVYEVRKTSDNSLATIYSDKNGNNEIVQNGTSNVSDNYGAIEFYIVDNSDEMEIKIGGVSSRFKNDVFIQQHMLKLSFNNIYEITSSGYDFEKGTFVSSGLTVWAVVDEVTNLILPNGLYLKAKGDIWADDFVNPSDTDDGKGLRIMRDHAEGLGQRVTLRSSGRNYLVQSTETLPEYGGDVGLYISDLSKVWVNFGGSAISFDTGIPSLGSTTKDALLALAPPTNGDSEYAFGNIKNLVLDGGNWPVKSNRPINVLRGNYRILAYSSFEEIMLSNASSHVWNTDGFVMLLRKIRCRFAGVLGTGIRMETTNAAKTGYLLDGCTVDYAGLKGFEITGSSGHTYCHFNNCHADFVGLDDSGVTISNNVGNAYAYDLEDVRVVNLTACGVEFSTGILRAKNARSLSVDGLFSLGAGHSDGVTEVDNLINLSGFCEQVQINNFENRSPSDGGYDTVLSITNPSQFNTNTIQLDNSIGEGNVRFNGGEQSSSNIPLVIAPWQNYDGQNRRGAGDVVKTGKKSVGASGNAWYSPSDVLEQTFYANVSDTASEKDLLEITTQSGGAIGFEVSILSVSSTALVTSKYIGSFTIDNEQALRFEQPVPLALTAHGDNPTLTYSSSILSVNLPNIYCGYYIKVTAVQRPGENYIRFNWL